jgi:hypothetical protein
MLGQFIRRILELVGTDETLLLLSSGDLKAETQSEVTAAQEQTLQTKYQATEYCKRKLIANADYVNILIRQSNTYCQ